MAIISGLVHQLLWFNIKILACTYPLDIEHGRMANQLVYLHMFGLAPLQPLPLHKMVHHHQFQIQEIFSKQVQGHDSTNHELLVD